MEYECKPLTENEPTISTITITITYTTKTKTNKLQSNRSNRLHNKQEIEAEMARTQKNKATNYHLGTLKAKLAKLRNELLIEQGGGGGGGPSEGFDVARLGDARVALIGFPSGELRMRSLRCI